MLAVMTTSDPTAGDEKRSPSYIASVGGYVGILFVTACARMFTGLLGLGDEYHPP
jgi:hypothetical protein